MEKEYSHYLSLIEEITKHDILYEEGTPEISDGEYDDLYFELLTLEKKHPDWITETSPSQKVNTKLVSKLEKRKHETPMLSQNKIKTEEGIRDFVDSISSDIIIGEKLDGLTIVLEYFKGKLNFAVTRGNGYVGEVVTHNILTVKNVPKVIDFKGKLILRGEALMPIAEFDRINTEGQYSNPRNLASGTLRQLDASICAERNMIVKIFDFVYADSISFKTDSEALNWIKSLGFDIVTSKIFKRSASISDEIIDYIKKYETSIRKTLPYQIDGMVLKSNSYEERDKLGYTSKWPRWSTAFKFKAQEATTTLREVIHQVGKTGKITPVAIFDKINIETDIERATLNNYKLIDKMNLYIGSRITVIKSNDVIPKITSVIKTKSSGTLKKIEYPKTCPICGSRTEFIGENLFCTGTNCPAQVKMSLINFASRNAMNILGLGEEIISDLYDKGYITSIQDIYNISTKEDEICNLKGYGKKKVENIKKGIEETKNKSLDCVLTSLSIRLIGKETAKEVANKFKNLDNLINSAKNKDDFYKKCLELEDFGDAKTESLYNYFADENNINLIKFLQSKGVNPKVENSVTKNKNKFIDGKTFVITGDLIHYKNRDELKKEIEDNGGKCTGSVSSKTDYLINNDSTSSSGKNKKAKELGIEIITEDEFILKKTE